MCLPYVNQRGYIKIKNVKHGDTETQKENSINQ